MATPFNAVVTASMPAVQAALWEVKLKAGAIHLGGSAVLLTMYLALVIGVWYPSPFLQLEEGWRVMLILIGVDLAAGPLLTTIVYRPGKPGLRFDLTVIVTVQLMLFAWGTFVTFEERPAYVVFNIDRFTILSTEDVDTEGVDNPFLAAPHAERPLMVYMRPPQTHSEKTRAVTHAFFEAGTSMTYQAERYESYYDHVDIVVAAGIDIESKVKASADNRRAMEVFLAEAGGVVADYAFLPIEGRKNDTTIAVARSTGKVAGYVDIDPW